MGSGTSTITCASAYAILIRRYMCWGTQKLRWNTLLIERIEWTIDASLFGAYDTAPHITYMYFVLSCLLKSFFSLTLQDPMKRYRTFLFHSILIPFDAMKDAEVILHAVLHHPAAGQNLIQIIHVGIHSGKHIQWAPMFKFMSRVYYIFIDYVVLWASGLRIWMRVGLGASKLREFSIIWLEREHAECCFQFSRHGALRQHNTAQHKTDTDQFRTTNDSIARNAFAISSFCHTIIIFEINFHNISDTGCDKRECCEGIRKHRTGKIMWPESQYQRSIQNKNQIMNKHKKKYV